MEFSTQIESEGVKKVNASLVVDDLYADEIIAGRGGVSVDSSTEKLSLHGTLRKFYKFEEAIAFDRYSILQFQMENILHPGKLEICFYESRDEALITPEWYETRCKEILSFESQDVSISIGEVFNYRYGSIEYLYIVQTELPSRNRIRAHLIVDSFKIIKQEIKDIDEKNCKDFDENSLEIEVDSQNICACREGYVSSNQGKIINKYDKCVKNAMENFDFQACDHFSECASGYCVNRMCKSSGSLDVISHETTANPIIASRKSGSGQGGEIVEPDNSLKLFDNVISTYELSTMLNVTKYTTLQIVGASRQSIQSDVCILPSQDSSIINTCPTLCFDLKFGTEEFLAIDLGKELIDRKIGIKFIQFRQTNYGRSSNERREFTLIKSLEFHQKTLDSLLIDNGLCRDANSKPVRAVVRNNNIPVTCECLDGFMSSNGGKFITEFDSCIKCYSGSSNKCFIEPRIQSDAMCSKVSLDEALGFFYPNLLMFCFALLKETSYCASACDEKYGLLCVPSSNQKTRRGVRRNVSRRKVFIFAWHNSAYISLLKNIFYRHYLLYNEL